MPLDWLIPGCISDIAPHHCESTPCDDSKEQKVDSSEPSVHIRYEFVTARNIGDKGAFRLRNLNATNDDARTLVLETMLNHNIKREND